MRKFGITMGLFLLVSLFAAGTYAAGAAEGKKKKRRGYTPEWWRNST